MQRESLRLQSALAPLVVHVDDAREEMGVRALKALELAYETMNAAGWPVPLPDGGRGGSQDFDLYVRSNPSGELDGAYVSEDMDWGQWKGAQTYSVVDPSTPHANFDACVVSAYAQAVLLSHAPSASLSWRRATASWLSWMTTGTFGCDDVAETQAQEPWRSWAAANTPHDVGAPTLWAMISARHDRGSGSFVRDTWELARVMRAPNPKNKVFDFWAVLAKVIKVAREDLSDVLAEWSVVRFFEGPVGELFKSSNEGGHATLTAHATGAKFPYHSAPADPPLSPFGSAYFLIDVPQGMPCMRIWLEGESGVRWSMVAARLDEQGHDVGRVIGEPRSNPKNYLPVELSPETKRVLIVVTNMSVSGWKDIDGPGYSRSFRLIADRCQ